MEEELVSHAERTITMMFMAGSQLAGRFASMRQEQLREARRRGEHEAREVQRRHELQKRADLARAVAMEPAG